MTQINPLTMSDVLNAFKSTGKVLWIKRAFYIPFAIVVGVCSSVLNTTFATMPLVPFVGLFFPSLCIVLAAMLDQNRKVEPAIAIRSTLSMSLYMIFFAIPAALLMFVLLFKPLELHGFMQSFGPSFLSTEVPAYLSRPTILSGAYSLTVTISIFFTTQLTTRLDMSYLQARHGLSENEAHAKSVELLGSLNLAHGFSIAIVSAMWLVPMVVFPQIGLLFIAAAFTFYYFILKAIYDGSSNTDAVELKASKAVTSN